MSNRRSRGYLLNDVRWRLSENLASVRAALHLCQIGPGIVSQRGNCQSAFIGKRVLWLGRNSISLLGVPRTDRSLRRCLIELFTVPIEFRGLSFEFGNRGGAARVAIDYRLRL
jgi:hypothetical protein